MDGQGCAIATYALLLTGRKLRGHIGLSSWLSSQHILTALADANKALSTPVFLAHCQNDEVIRIENGLRLRDELLAYGISVEWHEYDKGGHWINDPEGEQDIVEFISVKTKARPN